MRPNRWLSTGTAAALAGVLALAACSESGDQALLAPVNPQMANLDITAAGQTFTINQAKWMSVYPFGVGTGVIDPFLTIQDSPNEQGFNTDFSPLPLDAKRPNFTDALPLNNVPVIMELGGTWREFILDANESKSGTGPQFSIDYLDIWVCHDPAAKTYSAVSDFESNSDCVLVWDIGGDAPLLATSDNTSGSGSTLDYRILIPADLFGNDANAACQYNPLAADCGYYIIVNTSMGAVGGVWATDATFEEFSTIKRGFITVSKTAVTSYDRTWEWTIDKVVDTEGFAEGTYDELEETANVQENQTLEVFYKVTLGATSHDSNFKVEGVITIGNPSSDPVEIASVDDIMDEGLPTEVEADVDCGVSFPYTLNPGQSLMCDYEADLDDGTELENVAHITLADLAAVSSLGVPVTFGDPTNEIDECVDISDIIENQGIEVGSQNLGTVCAGDPPADFVISYSYVFGPEDIELECDENTFDNTATAVTNDTETSIDDDAQINIFVECEEGCTLTQGYWKTHNETFRSLRNGHGPPADPTWDLLPGGDAENTMFYSSGKTWFEVFNTPVAGNQYYALAHQYMAAVLNELAGADTGDVDAAMDAAHTLFSTYTPAQVAAMKGNNPVRAQFVSLAGTLGAFNEGLTGPGHCTDNDPM